MEASTRPLLLLHVCALRNDSHRAAAVETRALLSFGSNRVTSAAAGPTPILCEQPERQHLQVDLAAADVSAGA